MPWQLGAEAEPIGPKLTSAMATSLASEPPSWWRRKPVLIGLGIATLVSVPLIWQWWTATPWEDLEESLQSFPAPTEFGEGEFSHFGDRPAVCDINIGCEDPGARIEGYIDVRADVACELMAASLEEWHGAEFSVAPVSPVDYPTLGCMWEIEVDGKSGLAFVDELTGSTWWAVVLKA